MEWIGHAGLGRHRPAGAPDASSIRRALSLELAALEIDVAVTADDVLVCIHDSHIGAGRPVTGQTLGTLRHAVPGLLTLDEVDAMVMGQVPLLLDLKGDVAEPLAEWLRRRAAPDPEIHRVCTDDLTALLRLRHAAPMVPRWRTLPRVPPGRLEGPRRWWAAATRVSLPSRLSLLTREVAAAGVCIDRWALTRALVAEIGRLGLEATAWTVSTPRALGAAAATGIRCVTTDSPELLGARVLCA